MGFNYLLSIYINKYYHLYNNNFNKYIFTYYTHLHIYTFF